MHKKDYKIHIIGAGISGLIAARVLEENGFSPTIIEATKSVGGRVKTDIVDGYQLDHGFQVLLTSYPAAQKYLDFETLDLQKFLPGASIFKNGKQKIIGDPLRETSFLFSTLFSGIGNFSDKIKILQLNNKLKKKTIVDIFAEEEVSTLSYLSHLGFSDKMINEFFKPFFSGIFLEDKLETSSRMFEFIYKMFGEGYAALPKDGIKAIPEQLYQKLKQTTFKFDTKVTAVKDGEITLETTTKLDSDFTIIATDAHHLVSNLKNQTTLWKSCNTLYFESEQRIIKKSLIGLIPHQGTLINNIFYHTSLTTNATRNKELLSVTVIDNKNVSNEALIEMVKEELKTHCGIDNLKFIKHYYIPMALPKLHSLKYDMLPSETRLNSKIFLAGDTQLNGSLNAAMMSGERAALGIIEALSGYTSSQNIVH
ncbi:MAG: NAD(P)/FAD-dependent oxidoreductase [Algibacter sp.]|uniref:NAD(P)/FAD-dependent oxidoreductase n=1 Tax=Algibacter sp. TaxID=1872428 RepID=UPI00261AA430|nr:NAD(P)/FAD-dependent oxidoreductase [Algibacter sp.]MDG1729747.1 NAD(P)/FAD-dependent oxidoreductase [Algibacter sp.]MDG2177901.1 NAD(P)/FAD-dependent oxidoreductase [Algibacter sp.]